MLILRESSYIYVRNLKTWLAQPTMIVAAVFSSAVMYLFFGEPLRGITGLPGFPASDYQAFLTAMVIVMAVVFSGSDMAMVLLTDMMSGYVDKLLLSPVNRFSILLGTLLIGGTRAMAQVLAIILVATAIGVRFEGGVLGILAVIVGTTLLGVAMGCVGLIVAMRTRSVQVTVNSWLLFMPLAFLTSAFMPRDLLTGWFQVAVGLNPIEYIMVAVRAVIIEGWIWDSILPGIWVLLATTLVLVGAATYEYRRATN